MYVVMGSKELSGKIELGNLKNRGFRIRSRNANYGIGPWIGPAGDLNGDGQPDFGVGEISGTAPGGEPAGDKSFLYVIYGPYGEKSFIRGDANQDGRVDISDAIAILTYLFAGGQSATCADAMDVDDTGVLEITDGIRLLTYLFLGRSAAAGAVPAAGNRSDAGQPRVPGVLRGRKDRARPLENSKA